MLLKKLLKKNMEFQLRNNYNMENKIILSFVILVLFLVATFYFVFLNENKIKLVNSEEFESIISEEDIFLLQAHVPYYGEIKDTDLIMRNWKEPSSYVDELPEDKNTKLAVYCRSGRMSALTSEKLMEMGYTNIYELEGGMNSWEASGRKLIVNEEK